MEIVAALFIDDMAMRQVPGGASRIDLTGIQFSGAAPQAVPYTWAPHLVVLVRCPPDGSPVAALEVSFHIGEDEVARNVQPLQIQPGKFGRQLVRPEITFEDYTTVEARCRIDLGPVVTVPYTLLPPVA